MERGSRDGEKIEMEKVRKRFGKGEEELKWEKFNRRESKRFVNRGCEKKRENYFVFSNFFLVFYF